MLHGDLGSMAWFDVQGDGMPLYKLTVPDSEPDSDIIDSSYTYDDDDDDANYTIVVPGHYNAMYYERSDSFENTAATIYRLLPGNCPYSNDTTTNAIINSDYICAKSITAYDDNAHCNVGFTEVLNEWLVYNFKKEKRSNGQNIL